MWIPLKLFNFEQISHFAYPDLQLDAGVTWTLELSATSVTVTKAQRSLPHDIQPKGHQTPTLHGWTQAHTNQAQLSGNERRK